MIDMIRAEEQMQFECKCSNSLRSLSSENGPREEAGNRYIRGERGQEHSYGQRAIIMFVSESNVDLDHLNACRHFG